jgi:hypothetical protein
LDRLSENSYDEKDERHLMGDLFDEEENDDGDQVDEDDENDKEH